MSHFVFALSHLLAVEGGYVDHPMDKGGPTNNGITIKTLSDYLGRTATVDDVRNLDEYTTEDLYRVKFWGPSGGDRIDSPAVASVIFDRAVHGGVDSAVRQAQRVAMMLTNEYLKVDGQFGTVTAQFVNSVDPALFCKVYMRQTRDFYASIIERNPEQRVFLRGWLNRINQLEDFVCSALT